MNRIMSASKKYVQQTRSTLRSGRGCCAQNAFLHSTCAPNAQHNPLNSQSRWPQRWLRLTVWKKALGTNVCACVFVHCPIISYHYIMKHCHEPKAVCDQSVATFSVLEFPVLIHYANCARWAFGLPRDPNPLRSCKNPARKAPSNHRQSLRQVISWIWAKISPTGSLVTDKKS